ncbi:interleukin-5 receptor subunit alpha isoform X2 [Hyla sarda]|uniref:interleukin-5 receptor subunit alpha isoform X2 n=1 Tax=Hyla sarda TaxID=327740 RepID=UPI0024C410A0|nr:interleukin-5 receptor subunit alpha isoform X2 [Hyla sarda]
MVCIQSDRVPKKSAEKNTRNPDGIKPPQDLDIAVNVPGQVVLTWQHIVPPKNKSITYTVKLSTPGHKQEIKTSTNTSTQQITLHRGLTVDVAAEIKEDGSKSGWVSKSIPPYSGVEGTSATDLSCEIYLHESEKCNLSCKWTPGKKAPADTEYSLSYRYGTNTESCQDFVTEPGGQRQTGCHILSSIISMNNTMDFLVHVNGTSKSLQIKAVEKIFNTQEIEIIPPVRNLKMDLNGLHWKKPINSFKDNCFIYEVNIWSKDSNDTIKVRHSNLSNNFLQKHSNRQSIRVRAVGKLPCWIPNRYSAWTDIIEIGEVIDRSDSLGIIVPVCLTVACVGIFLLCIRFWGHMFPQIPKPNNDLKESFQNVQSQALVHCHSLDSEEMISYIEELVESDKYKMSDKLSGYGYVENYSSSGLYKTL